MLSRRLAICLCLLLPCCLLCCAAPSLAQHEETGNGPLQAGKSPPPEVVKELLHEIVERLEKQSKDMKEVAQLEILPILELTTKKLGIKVQEADKAAAQKDWQKFVRLEGPAMQRDLPRQQAKKILVWVLQWLYRHGQNMTESSPRQRGSHTFTRQEGC